MVRLLIVAEPIAKAVITHLFLITATRAPMARLLGIQRKYRVRALCCLVLLLAASAPAYAETVQVKYRGALDLSPFQCDDITRSSFVKRVCYDGRNRYMVIRLKSTYYHYCEVPAGVVSDFLAAPSMGRHYNKQIKVSSNGGLYDCRKYAVPHY